MTQTVQKNPSSSGLSNIAAALTILICLVVGYVIWDFVLGASSNFMNGDPNGDPLPGNLMGMMYKGGFVIAILIGLLTTTVVFAIERFFVISKASGTGDAKAYVAKVQSLVNANQIDEAIELSDTQKRFGCKRC